MDWLRFVIIAAISGIVVFVLTWLGAKTKPDADGWHHLRPSGMHWFATIGCGTFSALLTFIGINDYRKPPNPTCACENTPADIFAFWSLLALFCIATICMGIYTYLTYKRRIRWRGNELAFIGITGDEVQDIKAISKTTVRWTKEHEIVFFNGKKILIDPYATGALPLLQHIENTSGPNWFGYETIVEGHASEIMVDMNAGRQPAISAYQSMSCLRVFMRSPQPDGLASAEEFDQLDAIATAVAEKADSNQNMIFIGRNSSNGAQDYYFYCKDNSAEAILNQAMLNWPNYRFKICTQSDPLWKNFKEFIFPSVEEYHTRRNRDQVEFLAESGDQANVARDINHYASFATRDNLAAFSETIRDRGFQILPVTTLADGSFGVQFSKHNSLSAIDKMTIALDGFVKQYGGEYDGWGCDVAKKATTATGNANG